MTDGRTTQTKKNIIKGQREGGKMEERRENNTTLALILVRMKGVTVFYVQKERQRSMNNGIAENKNPQVSKTHPHPAAPN